MKRGKGTKPKRRPYAQGGNQLKVLLYVGPLRPDTDPDKGRLMVDTLLASRHALVGIILESGDPLCSYAKKRGIPIHRLPRLLTRPFRQVTEALHSSHAARAAITRWAAGALRAQPDIGVVFYGHWVPPELYEVPPLGFLNYHPAPLPAFRGMEPDTFAVLEGRRSLRGTVHRVALHYDEGPIYAYTRAVPISRYTTPLALFDVLSDAGIVTVKQVLDRLASGRIVPRPQSRTGHADASRSKARNESYIRWAEDTGAQIERRRRAFIGQDIGIRLKAELDGRLVAVEDCETHVMDAPGGPGDILGYYEGKGLFRGAPLVRTIDGVCVIRTGPPIDPSVRPEPPSTWLLPAGRRPRSTQRARIRRSLTGEARTPPVKD